MPDNEQTSVLFERYLENPKDPAAAVVMAKQPEVTGRYLDAFISNGRIAELDIRSRVHILALIGIACRPMERNLLKKWLNVEPDANLKLVLQKKLHILGTSSES